MAQFSYKKFRRSIGQYKRHAKSLTVGTRVKKPFPYFLLQDRIKTLKAVKPSRVKTINNYEKKIMSATTGAKQNRLYAELIQKVK